MGTTADTLKQLRHDAYSGALGNASTETLNGYAAALCHPNAFGEFGATQFPQICETVRMHLLRAHIERLQTHITDLDAKNTRLTKWVIALAVAALISTAIQTFAAVRAELRVESQARPTASAPQTPEIQKQSATAVQSSSNPPKVLAPKQP